MLKWAPLYLLDQRAAKIRDLRLQRNNFFRIYLPLIDVRQSLEGLLDEIVPDMTEDKERKTTIERSLGLTWIFPVGRDRNIPIELGVTTWRLAGPNQTNAACAAWTRIRNDSDKRIEAIAGKQLVWRRSEVVLGLAPMRSEVRQ